MKRSNSCFSTLRYVVTAAAVGIFIGVAARPALADGWDHGWHRGWHHEREREDDRGPSVYVVSPPVAEYGPPAAYYVAPPPPPPPAVYVPVVPASPPQLNIVLPLHF